MLVLSRKKGEAVLIGDNIKISILEVDGDKVSIGVDAPKEIAVLREELVTQTISYNKESLKPKADLLKKLNELNKNLK